MGTRGQQFVLPDGNAQPLTIRIRDADDALLFQGRTYSFDFPCDPECTETLTPDPPRTAP